MSLPEPRGVHLVGSVPLENAELVFRLVSENLGDRVRRIPDGEPGERYNWIIFQSGVLERHPDVEPGNRPKESFAASIPAYRVREGTNEQAVDLRPLGYADAARSSYDVFRRLRSEGVVPAGVRFEVCLPTATAVASTFGEPGKQAGIERVYEAALRHELAEIQDAIDPADLAIQWDIVNEIGMWENVGDIFTPWFDQERASTLERISRLVSDVRPAVQMGFHFCYGDFGHQHWAQPRDTRIITEVANGLADEIDRPINWIHLPVPEDRKDPGYFEPLRDLKLATETELYLGLVHADDPDGTRARIDAARTAVQEFGVATECGLGRTPPEQVEGILRLSAEVTAPVS